jgi:hypothetical protein
MLLSFPFCRLFVQLVTQQQRWWPSHTMQATMINGTADINRVLRSVRLCSDYMAPAMLCCGLQSQKGSPVRELSQQL